MLFQFEAVEADTISLKNGDIIRGKVNKISEGSFVVETEYGGEIPVKMDFVNTLETDNPVTIKLKDDSFFNGLLAASQTGSVLLKSSGLTETLMIYIMQISEINPPLTEKGTKISGHVNIGGVKTSGNSDKQSFHVDTEIVARAETNRSTLGLHYNQGADDGKESENNTRYYMKYDYFFNAKWYTYINTDFTKDKFQDLDLRSTVSPGMGYQFLETDLINLSLETGPTYVKETYFEGEDRDFMSGRWAFNLSFWLFNKKYQIFHDHEGLFSIEDSSDVLVRGHTGMRFPVLKKLNFSAQIDNDYDNVPSEGNQKADTRYIVGLGYSF